MDWRGGGFERIAQRLHAITDDLARGFALAPHRSPFPGINAFEAEDAAIFFGRDDETRAVIERLDARRAQGGARFSVIIGASGAGKSSLLKAGVLPQLSRRRDQWVVLPAMRPEKAPIEALAKTLAEAQGDATAWRAWQDRLRGTNGAHEVSELAKDLRVGPARSATLLLPVDQLEELFTIADTAQRDAFLSLMLALLDPTSDLPIIAIATGRADVLQGLLETSPVAALADTMPLSPMPLDRVHRLVAGPAAVASLVIEEGLAAEIARDVESVEALPLLAQTLRLLYDRCILDKRLTVAAYHSLGDPEAGLNPVQNSVRLAADQALGSLNPSKDQFAALRDAFIPHLVRLRLDDARRVRQPAVQATLPGEAENLISALIEARLLTTRNEDGVAVVEATHEALFTAWPTLALWLEQEQQFLTDIERLKSSYTAWEETPDTNKPKALLHGLLLANARDWVVRYPRRFSGREMEPLRAFIGDSARSADLAEARIRRQRLLVVRVLAAASIIFLGAAIVSFREYRQATEQQGIAAEQRAAAIAQEEIAQAQRDRATAALRAAQLNESRFLTVKAQASLEADPQVAALIALGGLPPDMRHPDREIWPALVSVLADAYSRDQLESVLTGRTDTVTGTAFSPNGTRIVTASDHQTAQVWSADSGAALATLTGHAGDVNSAVFSPDGTRIVTASKDCTARLWDANTGAALATLTGHTGDVHSAVFSPDGRRIITTSADHTARLWDANTGAALATLKGHTDDVTSAVFSPDGARIVTASDDTTARLWDGASGAPLATLMGHSKTVIDAEFSPDGTRIATASLDHTARLWDGYNGAPLATLVGHTDFVVGAMFSPDGKRIATASSDHTARLWDAQSGAVLATLTGHSDRVWSADFSRDGMRIVTASSDSTARLWDANTGTPIATLATPKGHAGRTILFAMFSPDGARIAVASNFGPVWVLDANRDTPLATLTGHTNWVLGAEFSPDGTRVVTASSDHTARLWEVPTGAPLATLTGHTDVVRSAAFSPDGSRIVTASHDETAAVWDAHSGALLTQLVGHMDWVVRATFSPDGTRIVTASKDNIPRIWHAESGGVLAHLVGHSHEVNDAEFSPDGRRVVTASADHTARLWDAQTGVALATLAGHSGDVWSATFSPDGARIVTASDDMTARLWDGYSGAALATLTGHTDNVRRALFSPDGMRVVTTSYDHTAKLWDAQTGALIATLPVQTNTLPKALFSPDGLSILTVSPGDRLRLWDTKTGAMLATLSISGWDAGFSPDGTRIVTWSDDPIAHLWKVWLPSIADVVTYAEVRVLRDMTPLEREQVFLGSLPFTPHSPGDLNEPPANLASLSLDELRELAAIGNPYAHRRLAELYELGQGVDASLERAVFHHAIEARLFADAGNEDELQVAVARRGMVARALPPKVAVRAAYAAMDWQESRHSSPK